MRTTQPTEHYLYGGQPAEVRPADGTKGVLIRTLGGEILFRVYDGRGGFTDYEIRHDDLSITIDGNALAAFYRIDGHDILDHAPRVLGLKGVKDEEPRK